MFKIYKYTSSIRREQYKRSSHSYKNENKYFKTRRYTIHLLMTVRPVWLIDDMSFILFKITKAKKHSVTEYKTKDSLLSVPLSINLSVWYCAVCCLLSWFDILTFSSCIYDQYTYEEQINRQTILEPNQLIFLSAILLFCKTVCLLIYA